MFAQQQMSGINQSRPVVKTKPIISFQVLLTVFILFRKKSVLDMSIFCLFLELKRCCIC